MTEVLYFGAGGLLLIGLAGMLLNTHLVRIVLALGLLESGANLLLLLASYDPRAHAPIRLADGFPSPLADPVPQALVLTSIVIGIGVMAVALVLALRAQAVWGSLDVVEIRRRMDAEIAARAGLSPVEVRPPRGATPGEDER